MLFRSNGGPSWLAVFLGNPGPRYSGTRHNAGFMAADALAKEKGISVDRLRFRALTAELRLGDERVLVMKPQTYMNLSGEAVGAAARFYKIPPERVLVVSDEVSLPPGRLRVRLKGSAGAPAGTTASRASSRRSAATPFPVSASASARRRTRITTWPTGCSACSGTVTPRRWPPPRSARRRPWNATSPRARSGP